MPIVNYPFGERIYERTVVGRTLQENNFPISISTQIVVLEANTSLTAVTDFVTASYALRAVSESVSHVDFADSCGFAASSSNVGPLEVQIF